jgi:predicted secreted protein
MCLEGLKKITKIFSQDSRWSAFVINARQNRSSFRDLAQCQRVEFQPRSDAQCSFHVSLKWACAQDYVLFHMSVGLTGTGTVDLWQ